MKYHVAPDQEKISIGVSKTAQYIFSISSNPLVFHYRIILARVRARAIRTLENRINFLDINLQHTPKVVETFKNCPPHPQNQPSKRLLSCVTNDDVVLLTILLLQRRS